MSAAEAKWPSNWWIIRATALVVLTVAALNAVAGIASILVLVFIGAFVAVGIEPVVAKFEARNWRRGWIVLGLAVALLVAVTAIAVIVAIPLARQLQRLIDATPAMLERIGERFDGLAAGEHLLEEGTQTKVSDLVNSLVSHADGLFGAIFGAAGGVLGFVASALTVAVVTVYFSLALPRLRAGARRVLKDDAKAALLDDVLGKVGAYVSGQALVCVTAGVTSFVAFLVLGVPYAALLAIIVLMLDAIPQIGAFLGAVVAVVVSLSDSLGTAIAVAVFFAIYQLLENYLIAPRVFSTVIQLSPLTSFLAILLGGALAGVLGAVAALPLTAAGFAVARHLMGTNAGESAHLPDAESPPVVT